MEFGGPCQTSNLPMGEDGSGPRKSVRYGPDDVINMKIYVVNMVFGTKPKLKICSLWS